MGPEMCKHREGMAETGPRSGQAPGRSVAACVLPHSLLTFSLAH